MTAAPALSGANKVRAYVALTKPRVIELLLFTTVPTMVLAAQGLPPLGLIGWTLLGGTLAAGSANTINCVIDRDIDAVMNRTKLRPLVTGAISPRNALIYGIAQGVAAFGVLWMLVNPLSAWLALAAILFYVFVYTLGLKRRTSQNIVWGGAAGCMPVLIGWSAVTNSLSWSAWVLFGVIFLWTPPHYWPLSMRYRDDYDSVHVPMLGVVRGPEHVASHIIRYSWAMVACSLVLIPVAPMGWTYSIASVLLGAWFLIEAYQLRSRSRGKEVGSQVGAMRVFHVSITYLTLLFAAVALDPILGL